MIMMGSMSLVYEHALEGQIPLKVKFYLIKWIYIYIKAGRVVCLRMYLDSYILPQTLLITKYYSDCMLHNHCHSYVYSLSPTGEI